MTRNIVRAMADPTPGTRQFSAGVTCSGTTYTAIPCGSPPMGTKWELTQLAVGPLDPFAPPLVGVQACVMRTVGHPSSSNIAPTSLPGIIAPPAPIPNSLTLDPHVVHIGLNEQLVVVIQNAPAGLVILVDFEVKQSALGDYRRRVRRHWIQASVGVG
jgi:hypothetical protein